MTKADVAQLLSDQISAFYEGRKLPMIEPDCFDDAEGDGFQHLDRWMDRKYKPRPRTW